MNVVQPAQTQPAPFHCSAHTVSQRGMEDIVEKSSITGTHVRVDEYTAYPVHGNHPPVYEWQDMYIDQNTCHPGVIIYHPACNLCTCTLVVFRRGFPLNGKPCIMHGTFSFLTSLLLTAARCLRSDYSSL